MIRVEVINHDQPNRPLVFWHRNLPFRYGFTQYRKRHLRFDSVKITTLDYKEPKIRVEAWPNEAGEVKVRFWKEK